MYKLDHRGEICTDHVRRGKSVNWISVRLLVLLYSCYMHLDELALKQLSKQTSFSTWGVHRPLSFGPLIFSGFTQAGVRKISCPGNWRRTWWTILWNCNFNRNAHILASKYLCPNFSVLVCFFCCFFKISNILKAKFPSGLLGLRSVVWLSDKRIVENKQIEVLKGTKKPGIILRSFLSMPRYLKLDKATPIYSTKRWDW